MIEQNNHARITHILHAVRHTLVSSEYHLVICLVMLHYYLAILLSVLKDQNFHDRIGPFVRVNCSNTSSTSVESLLLKVFLGVDVSEFGNIHRLLIRIRIAHRL